MFYFQTNQLGFTPEFLGRVRGIQLLFISYLVNINHVIHTFCVILAQPGSVLMSLPSLFQIRFAGSIASLVGVALFNVWLKKVPLKKMLM